MIRLSIARFLLLVCAAAGVLSQVVSANESSVISYRIKYAMPDADSLAERLKQVDVVAVVRIADAGRARVAQVSLNAIARDEDIVPDADLPPVILTERTADVLEILKSSSRQIAPGALVNLLQHGGEITWHERQVRTHAEVPALSAGVTYLVFLNYNEASGGMMVSPFDVFRVDRGIIEAGSASSTKYASSLVGLPPQDAFAAVRRALREHSSD
ncbi:MAG TPA: hypothetical protein VJM31_12280 [Vicinamibacterales bacterium]|nr:hypothetical protein [Vicinamibacterales bacterium]